MNDIDAINLEISKLQTTYAKKSLKIRETPVPIFRGSLDNVTATYVYIYDTLHKFNTTLEAIEFCFIAFKALDVPFPNLTQHLWSFIQKTVYHITLPKTISCVDSLIKKMQGPIKRKKNP